MLVCVVSYKVVKGENQSPTFCCQTFVVKGTSVLFTLSKLERHCKQSPKISLAPKNHVCMKNLKGFVNSVLSL